MRGVVKIRPLNLLQNSWQKEGVCVDGGNGRHQQPGYFLPKVSMRPLFISTTLIQILRRMKQLHNYEIIRKLQKVFKILKGYLRLRNHGGMKMKQTDFKELDKHITILGWLHIGLNILTLCVGVLVFFVLIGAGLLSGDGEAMSVLTVVGTFVMGILVVVSIPGILAGWGLLKRKSWARILALVIGFLSLMNFPLGTLVGAYTIWALLVHNEASDYFLAYSA